MMAGYDDFSTVVEPTQETQTPQASGYESLSPATPQQSAPPEESQSLLSTKAGRFAQGMAEPAIGGAQVLGHVAADPVGRLLLGIINPAFGMMGDQGGAGLSQAADALAQKAADIYQKSRTEAGIKPNQLDYWAGAGNIASPINLLPGSALSKVEALSVPAAGRALRIAQTLGRGTAGGASFGAMQPVTDLAPSETFEQRKAMQTGIGGLTGAVAEPVMSGLSNAAYRVGRQFFPQGRTKAAAERLGQIITEHGENPKDLAATMEAPGAQGTVAEQTGSPVMAGVEQRLEADDPVFAQKMERARQQTQGGLQSGAEQSVAGADPMLVRDAALRSKDRVDTAFNMLKEATTAKHEKELGELQDQLDLARHNVTSKLKKIQSDTRSKFKANAEDMTEKEANAQSQYERVGAAFDELIADTDKRAQEAASAFRGAGPLERQMANAAQAEIQQSVRDELKGVERTAWDKWRDQYGEHPVTNTKPFAEGLRAADEYGEDDAYHGRVKKIIGEWTNAAENDEPITGAKAQKDRSIILSKARDASSGATPNTALAAAYNKLAEGIYESMSSVPGTDIPRAVTRAVKERFGQTYPGELGRTGHAGAPLVAPELTLEKAMSGEGSPAAMRMRQLEEVATPLAITPRTREATPNIAPAPTPTPEPTPQTPRARLPLTDRAKQVEKLLAEKQDYLNKSINSEDDFEKHYYYRMANDLTFRRYAEGLNPKDRGEIIKIIGETPPYTKTGLRARSLLQTKAEGDYTLTPSDPASASSAPSEPGASSTASPAKPASAPKESARAKVKRISDELTQQRAATEPVVAATPAMTPKPFVPRNLRPTEAPPGVGDLVNVEIGAMEPMPAGRIVSISTRTGPGLKVGTTMETKYAKLDTGQEMPLNILKHPKVAAKPMTQASGLVGGEKPSTSPFAVRSMMPPEAVKPETATTPALPTPAPAPKPIPRPTPLPKAPTPPGAEPPQTTGLSSDRSPEVRANQERFLRLYAEKLVDPATGKMNANATDTFLSKNKALLDRFPGLSNDLQQAANAAREVKTVGTKVKLDKAEQQAVLARTIGEIQNERAALKRAAFDQLVSPETGRLHHSKVEAYLRDNNDVIRKFPGLRNEILDAAKHERTLADVEDLAKPELRAKDIAYKERMSGIRSDHDSTDKRAFSIVANTEDPTTAIKKIFNSNNKLEALLDVGRMAKAGPKGAAGGLRRLVFDYGSNQSTERGALNFQKLHDFYFKPFGNHGYTVAEALNQVGAMKDSQIRDLKEMLQKGIQHQAYRTNANAVNDVTTPLSALLEGAFRSVGAHYGALLTPGAGIHGAAAGAKMATRALKLPASRMEDLFKQALEDPTLMKALLEKSTPNNESTAGKTIRQALVKAGILHGIDINNRRPAPHRVSQ